MLPFTNAVISPNIFRRAISGWSSVTAATRSLSSAGERFQCIGGRSGMSNLLAAGGLAIVFALSSDSLVQWVLGWDVAQLNTACRSRRQDRRFKSSRLDQTHQ